MELSTTAGDDATSALLAVAAVTVAIGNVIIAAVNTYTQ